MGTLANISAGNIFINQYGKQQRVPEGYYYAAAYGELRRNTKEYDMNKSHYQTDYRSSTAVPPSVKTVQITDSVRFKMKDAPQNREGAVVALQNALGLTFAAATHAFDNESWLICRPDQFGRFMIIRGDYVAGNQFKSLEAKLIPSVENNIFDVRGN